MSDEPDYSEREALEYLCWSNATSAERFFPPEETAIECMAAHSEVYEEHDDMDYDEGLAWEMGQHGRALSDAAEFFDDLVVRGFDPVRMAEQHIEDAREEGLDGLPDIDWDWLQFHGRLHDEYEHLISDKDYGG